MKKNHSILDYAAKREITDLLRQAYVPRAAAEKIEQLCQGKEGPMGGVALLCMGLGHIDLAEILRDRGANPFTDQPSGDLRSIDGIHSGLDHVAGLTVPWLLARWRNYDLQTKGKPCTGFSHSQPRSAGRMATFNHAIRNPERWPVDVNVVISGQSALLVGLGECNSYDRHGKIQPKGPLYRVPEEQVMEYAHALLRHGADINLPGTHWSTLAACLPDNDGQAQANLDRFQWALASGADPMHLSHAAWARAISEDAETSYGKRGPGPRALALDALGVPLVSPVDVPAATSPLVQAVRRQARWAIDRMLTNEDFDARWRDPENGNTLLTTFNRTKKATVALLAALPQDHLADVVNDNTPTPALHLAVESLYPDMVKLVLDLGADPDVRNARGKTALEALRLMTDRKRDDFQAIADLVKQAGGTIEGPIALVRAAKATAVETIDSLLGQGVDVYTRDPSGRMAAQLVLTGPALTVAGLFDAERSERHIRALEAFVRHGFDVNTPLDSEGTTLLHYAVERCSVQAVEFLIDKGADPNAVGKKGKTPLHMWDHAGYLHCYQQHPAELLDLAIYLVKAGAEPEYGDAQGRVCLDDIGQRMAGFRQTVIREVMEGRTKAADAAAKPLRF